MVLDRRGGSRKTDPLTRSHSQHRHKLWNPKLAPQDPSPQASRSQRLAMEPLFFYSRDQWAGMRPESGPMNGHSQQGEIGAGTRPQVSGHMIRLGGLSKCLLQGAWLVCRQAGRSLPRLLSKRDPEEQRSGASRHLSLKPKQQPGLSIPGPPWPGIPGTGL